MQGALGVSDCVKTVETARMRLIGVGGWNDASVGQTSPANSIANDYRRSHLYKGHLGEGLHLLHFPGIHRVQATLGGLVDLAERVALLPVYLLKPRVLSLYFRVAKVLVGIDL